MPDAQTARAATGYERGTITPFGSLRPWPVIADTRIAGREITLGAGVHGTALAVAADDALAALNAQVATSQTRRPRPMKSSDCWSRPLTPANLGRQPDPAQRRPVRVREGLLDRRLLA